MKTLTFMGRNVNLQIMGENGENSHIHWVFSIQVFFKCNGDLSYKYEHEMREIINSLTSLQNAKW